MKTFENPPSHFGQYLANQELEWLPTDTKENYEKLIQDPGHQEYFANLGWDKPGAITYKFNSYGFRADEFDHEPCMVALGCSYSIGIGLPDEVTWARQTATALGLKCANLSWGGYSADSCFRLAEYWIPKLNTKYVCMLVPPRSRIELLLDEEILTTRQLPVEVFMPQSQSLLFTPSDTYLKHWFLNDENAKINQRKNILAVRQLCADLNISCTVHNAEEHMWWNRETIGYARDYMHGGPNIHNILTKKFVEAYVK
jgi:hypothetical protein